MPDQHSTNEDRFTSSNASIDPLRCIRLERDPTLPPQVMGRPSQLLAFGSGIPPQYRLSYNETKPLRFVVKRHRASKLHTDFRLEAFGVLLSWASYPRPSLDPRKRVEMREMGDHRSEYMESERRIPDGSYGAGPTIVWDKGFYRPLVPGEMDPEHEVVEALQRGRFDFWMDGMHLQGGFRLEASRKGWVLSKLEDEFATLTPLPRPDISVITQKSLDDLEGEYQAMLALSGRMQGRLWDESAF